MKSAPGGKHARNQGLNKYLLKKNEGRATNRVISKDESIETRAKLDFKAAIKVLYRRQYVCGPSGGEGL